MPVITSNRPVIFDIAIINQLGKNDCTKVDKKLKRDIKTALSFGALSTSCLKLLDIFSTITALGKTDDVTRSLIPLISFGTLCKYLKSLVLSYSPNLCRK